MKDIVSAVSLLMEFAFSPKSPKPLPWAAEALNIDKPSIVTEIPYSSIIDYLRGSKYFIYIEFLFAFKTFFSSAFFFNILISTRLFIKCCSFIKVS